MSEQPECICANRAKVESIVHPYCPRHAGGDPGPGIGVCQGPDCQAKPLETAADVSLSNAGEESVRLCTSCLLTAYIGAKSMLETKDRDLAEVERERDRLQIELVAAKPLYTRVAGLNDRDGLELGSSSVVYADKVKP